MEDKVNKLIEKIENDTIQQYDFNEVLDMLKDLLVSNKEEIKKYSCWEEDACNSDRRCETKCSGCAFLNY